MLVQGALRTVQLHATTTNNGKQRAVNRKQTNSVHLRSQHVNDLYLAGYRHAGDIDLVVLTFRLSLVAERLLTSTGSRRRGV